MNNEHYKILMKGVDVWNQWRKDNPDIVPDLSEADLRYANLYKANLYKANLSEANLKWANLRCANLKWANLRCADLSWADLSWADLSWADLYKANLYKANLSEANLYKADLDFACWPLWCGSINVKRDDRINAQLLYHAFIDSSIKPTEEQKDFINKNFHRVLDGTVKPL